MLSSYLFQKFAKEIITILLQRIEILFTFGNFTVIALSIFNLPLFVIVFFYCQGDSGLVELAGHSRCLLWQAGLTLEPWNLVTIETTAQPKWSRRRRQNSTRRVTTSSTSRLTEKTSGEFSLSSGPSSGEI